MTFLSVISSPKIRPALLMHAARAGQDHYRETRSLRHLLGQVPDCPKARIARLDQLETELNAQRKSGDAAYSCARHVHVMIALLAEKKRMDRSKKKAVDLLAHSLENPGE